jgi:hypothetical protein
MICKPYPLLLDRVFDENLVPIAPCDVGIEIGLDFVYYFLEGVVLGYKGGVLDIVKYCNIIKNILHHAINAYRDKIDPKIIIKIRTLNCFLIPRPDEMLPSFREYVIKTPDETRRTRRQAITTFIVQNLENPIGKQETFDFVNHLFE